MFGPIRRHPRIAWTLGAALGVPTVIVVAANAYVVLTGGKATGDVREVPHAQVAIVPGAFVQPDGRMSTMLADRVHEAAELWEAGKVDRILVSGDHHRWEYDEPDTMRDALEREGVPARVIFTDHAGFDTWATMVRAKQVFGVSSAVVVTQGFHMPRPLPGALSRARRHGPHRRPSRLRPAGRAQRRSRGSVAGEGGRGRHQRRRCRGRSARSDHRRRPRELGTATTAGHAALRRASGEPPGPRRVAVSAVVRIGAFGLAGSYNL
jgi:hypothetical protein